MFRYHSCSFINEKAKETAARITLYKQLGIWNCFTLEASFHGYYTKERDNFEFTMERYENLGEKLVSALYEYCMILEEDDRRRQIARIEKAKLKKKREEDEAALLKEKAAAAKTAQVAGGSQSTQQT